MSQQTRVMSQKDLEQLTITDVIIVRYFRLSETIFDRLTFIIHPVIGFPVNEEAQILRVLFGRDITVPETA